MRTAKMKRYASLRSIGAGSVYRKAQKPLKFKLGTRTITKICPPNASQLSIAKSPFGRLVRQVTEVDIGKKHVRFELLALQALEEVAECILISELEMANSAAKNAGRVTLQAEDMQLIRKLCSIMFGKEYPGGLR
ncbi:hypothetical protein B7463_g12269, partial [Scytalidium lignicola]